MPKLFQRSGVAMDRRKFLQNSGLSLAGLSFCVAQPGWSSSLSHAQGRLSNFQTPLTRFAFGSCNQSLESQSFWDTVASCEPQLWIWLGDNIYGDGLSMAQRRRRYARLKSDPYYSKFRGAVPIIGTWDDHDYAWNNHDGSFEDKEASKQQLIEFLDIPAESLAARSGIYQSYCFGPVGRRCKVILLDLRFNQDSSRVEPSLLGEEQWQWLQSELAIQDFDLLVIGSSLNLMAVSDGGELEGWSDFPGERARLYGLLDALEQPVLVLSGDRHQAEFASCSTIANRKIHEFMSSGLTHYWKGAMPNEYRIGEPVVARNFGVVEIDWGTQLPTFNLQIRSPDSGLILSEIRGVNALG